MKGANDVEVFGKSADNWRNTGVHTGCNQKSVCTSETNGLRRTSRAYGRIWKVWIIAIVISIAIPTYAFAATGDVLNYNDMAVVWGPNPVGRWGSGDNDENGVIVVANSMYNAAIVTCGYDVLDSRFTHEVKAKLSNASTGGNFYTFAQTFECFQGQDGYNYPSWNRSGTGVVDTLASLYGSSNVWWSIYDSYLLQSAKEDLQAILNGEDLGGGSGSGTGTASYTYTGKTQYYNGTSANYGTNKFQNGDKIISFSLNDSAERMPEEYYIKFRNTDLQDMYNSYPVSEYDYYAAISSVSNSSSATGWSWTINIYAIPKGKAELTYETLTIGNTTNRVPLILKTEISTRYYSLRITAAKATYSGTVFTVNSGNVGTVQSITANTANIINKTQQSGVLGTVYVMGGAGDTPVTPPTNWPDNPTQTPVTPPEVPEYDEPVSGNPPDYTPYSITTPYTDTSTGNTYVYNTYNNYSYDYTNSYPPDDYTDLYGWLNSIFNQLKFIQMRLTINLIELSAQIEDMIKGNDANTAQIIAKLEQIIRAINNAGSTINGTLGRVQAAIDAGLGAIYELIGDFMSDVHADFVSIGEYMESLFVWLAEQIEYSMGDGYDDSSVLTWLKKIYSKMGMGIRSKPVDPVADPVGAWDWLGQLIQSILGALSNVVGELTGTVGELFNGIKEKFPFSIPWDLAAILALFDAAPVTPQATIDYTIFEDGPISIPVHWDINMHYLDDTMGTIRAMEDIVFCFYLLLKTDWLSNVFDGIGDYLGGKFRTAVRS